MSQLYDKTELTTPVDADFLHIVDTSDTTDGVNGTSKKIRRDNLMTNFLTAFPHNSLASLTAGDPHTQYPFLTGRSGGQTIIGGTGTTDDLILRATSGVGTTGSFIDLQTGNNGANITRIDDTGNVGIGRTTPSSKFSGYKNLSVNSPNGSTLSLEANGEPRFLFTADGTNSYISSYDDNPITFSINTGNFTNSTGTERMRIDANGNIGVNVTPSAWGSVYKAIEGGSTTNQSAIVFRTDANRVDLYTNAFYDTTWKRKFTGTAGILLMQNNEFYHYGAASGSAGTPITWTQTMQLGLGTSLALQGASSQTGTGITFPASQNASSNANTLDDYEEGDWTPTYTTTGTDFSAITYDSARVGRYTKIGRQVIAWFVIATDAITVGSASGSVLIGGLPFTVANITNGYVAGSVGFAYNFGGDSPRGLLAGPNTLHASLYYRTTANGSDAVLLPADLGTGADSNFIYGTLIYNV